MRSREQLIEVLASVNTRTTYSLALYCHWAAEALQCEYSESSAAHCREGISLAKHFPHIRELLTEALAYLEGDKVKS